MWILDETESKHGYATDYKFPIEDLAKELDHSYQRSKRLSQESKDRGDTMKASSHTDISLEIARIALRFGIVLKEERRKGDYRG